MNGCWKEYGWERPFWRCLRWTKGAVCSGSRGEPLWNLFIFRCFVEGRTHSRIRYLAGGPVLSEHIYFHVCVRVILFPYSFPLFTAFLSCYNPSLAGITVCFLLFFFLLLKISHFVYMCGGQRTSLELTLSVHCVGSGLCTQDTSEFFVGSWSEVSALSISGLATDPCLTGLFSATSCFFLEKE